jgi:hypothetical protein
MQRVASETVVDTDATEESKHYVNDVSVGFENGFSRDLNSSSAQSVHYLNGAKFPLRKGSATQQPSEDQQHRLLSLLEDEEPQHRPPQLSELAQQVEGIFMRQIDGLEKRMRSALATDSSRFPACQRYTPVHPLPPENALPPSSPWEKLGLQMQRQVGAAHSQRTGPRNGIDPHRAQRIRVSFSPPSSPPRPLHSSLFYPCEETPSKPPFCSALILSCETQARPCSEHKARLAPAATLRNGE